MSSNKISVKCEKSTKKAKVDYLTIIWSSPSVFEQLY